MDHHYLIGYVGEAGHGSAHIARPAPITNPGDVDNVTAYLRDCQNDPTLIVTAFSRFEEPR